jgi:hypothetical protein
MNKLVNMLMANGNFPLLFTFNDFEKAGYKKYEFERELQEAIKNKYIDCVYNNIYTLNENYQKKIIPKGTLSQMIEPKSYISLYYVLWDCDMISESVFAITSVTNDREEIINTSKYGTFIYTKLYEIIPTAGIYIQNNFRGQYKIAKPLRALCDMVYFMKKNWTSIDSLYQVLRIDKDSLEENITKDDFEELQGKFSIINIENFLQGIRKELQI